MIKCLEFGHQNMPKCPLASLCTMLLTGFSSKLGTALSLVYSKGLADRA